MSSQIKITAGDIFSGNADALLISIDKIRYSTRLVQQRLLEYWRVEPKIFDHIPVGDIIISPVHDSNRKNNQNPFNICLPSK